MIEEMDADMAIASMVYSTYQKMHYNKYIYQKDNTSFEYP